jgi:hypothetical protein
MNKEEQEIIAANDPSMSYHYCYRNGNKADIKAHEKIMLRCEPSTRNMQFFVLFATKIRCENSILFEKKIIDYGDAFYCYYFALNNLLSNKDLLFKKILESKNIDIIKRFYNEVDFDKTKYETLMLFI